MNEVALSSETKEKCGKKEKIWSAVFAAGFLAMLAVMLTVSAHADLISDITSAAANIYKDVKTIATPIAGLSFVIALLISFLSHNQRAVDASRQTAKGILITWVVIMIAGAIFTYADGKLGSSKNDDLPSISTTTTTDTKNKG